MGPALLRGRAAVASAAVLAAALGFFWGATLEPTHAWGWDETMHAELPAVRMLLLAGRGEWGAALEVLHGCAQYPFGWPVVLALVQGVFGVAEGVARLAGIGAWAFTLWLLFLCGRELVDLAQPRRGAELVPWLAFALAALAPLPLAFAGTLFLEVPFAAAMALALFLWLRRSREDAGVALDLAAGAALAAACFVKWNYGLLLAAGLGLDALVGAVLLARRGSPRPALVRLGAVSVVPLFAALWWFVLPLPLGAATAAEHRAAFVGFLGGNRDGASTEFSVRALHWIGYFAISGRMLVLLLVGVLAAVLSRDVVRPGVRALFLVLVCMAGPILVHPFHLDRFLIPIGPPLWLLAALGLSRVLPTAPQPRAAVLALLALLTLVAPTFEARRLVEATVVAPKPPELQAKFRDYVGAEIERWARLGAGRSVPSAGLAPQVHEALSELVAAAAGPDDRVGWLGVSSEYSPAAAHLALLVRGGAPERFLRDAHRPIDITAEGVDPGWDAARLAEFVLPFDVVFLTDPPDLRNRGVRAFVRRYQQMLAGALGWRVERIGTIGVEQPLAAPREVQVYAARPSR